MFFFFCVNLILAFSLSSFGLVACFVFFFCKIRAFDWFTVLLSPSKIPAFSAFIFYPAETMFDTHPWLFRTLPIEFYHSNRNLNTSKLEENDLYMNDSGFAHEIFIKNG